MKLIQGFALPTLYGVLGPYVVFLSTLRHGCAGLALLMSGSSPRGTDRRFDGPDATGALWVSTAVNVIGNKAAMPSRDLRRRAHGRGQ